MDRTYEFDVFLSHNSKDKPEVRDLKRRLEARNIRVWFDEDQLIPGRNWQPLLEAGIETSETGVVLVGRDGLGPWEDEEMQAILREAVRLGKPVIPVLLPGAPTQPKLPMFLVNRTWVDMRQGFSEAGIEALIWGIKGEKPGQRRVTSDTASSNHPYRGEEKLSSPEGEAIRLLHLSDFHFRADRAWDADPVLRALARFIGKEAAGGLEPDLVVITGDLAFSGRESEYQLARQWLDKQLLPALGGKLTRKQVLLVPGNHDLDRSKVGRGVKYTQKGLLADKSQEGIEEVLSDTEERRGLLARHADYLSFLTDWSGEEHSLPWWRHTLAIRGHRLHLAGLNSAWMACGDEDRGRLLLGRYQLNQALVTPEAEDADLRIALLHHPWDYLAEFDAQEAKRSTHQHADLLLRGHLHEPEAARYVPPDPKRSCLELAAGCVYASSAYPNAFQWIELWPAARKARVHFRLWRDGEWISDRNQPGCSQGWAEFDLAGQDKASEVGAPPKPMIPAEYLTWLRERYAGIELLGFDQQQGRAITLDHVYVPAVTRPAREPERDDPALPGAGREAEPGPTLLLDRLQTESLYVPGPPGSGKSTFSRWAVLLAGPGILGEHPVPAPESYREPEPGELRGRLPLLVPLREFWKTMDCGRGRRTWSAAELEQALAAWVNRRRPAGLDGQLLRDHLATGSAFLVLDGLDEVPVSEPRDDHTDYPRALLLSGLAAALPAWERAGNRTLLTSRPYGLDEAELARLGLARAPLEPLPEGLQALFIGRWFHALGQTELGEGLLTNTRGREDLAPLVENPMLLTALCVIYGNGRRLPEDRYHLYQRMLDNVLYNRYPGDARQREPIKARLEAVAHGMHTGLEVDEARRAPAAEVGQREVERILQVFAQLEPAYLDGRVQPAAQREELLTRSGLLLPRPGERAAFYHLSFQEYLAAESIAHSVWDADELQQIFRKRSRVPEWRPTLLFLFAALVFNYRKPQWGLQLLQRLVKDLTRRGIKANPAPAVFIAEALELALAKAYQIPDGLADSFRALVLDAIVDEVGVRDRQALGLCLGRLGDQRIPDLREPAAYVEVPAGAYPYQEDETFTLKEPILLGRYPVTNGQFRAFIEDGGYDKSDHWSQEGRAWRQQEGVAEPGYWRNRDYNAPNQPVVGVSFWEAEACCAWAGGRLPREREWEAAARGLEGCEYPWCGPWEDGICNSAEAGLDNTSPVGLFPRSRQAQLGLEDLAGNVWEWCADLRDPDDGQVGPRVLRGGAFDFESRFLRTSYRDRDHPENRFWIFGFRCVLAPRRQA